MIVSCDYLNDFRELNQYDEEEVKHVFVNAFRDSATAYQIPWQKSRAIGACLFERMADKSLYYHTPVHVLGMMQLYHKLVRALVLQADPALEMAVWFHDVIYIPGDLGNESMSADFAVTLLCPWIKGKDCTAIKDLINATVLYNNEKVNPFYHTILDLDLASLAVKYEDFKRVGDLIRKEFPDKTDEEFNTGRKKFFKSLLKRPSIYRSTVFIDRFEGNARSNIEKFLGE